MGQRRCNQADQRGARPISAARNLHTDIEALSDATRNIGEAGHVLLGGVEDLNDGRSVVGIHAQHPGRNGHLRAAHLSTDQSGCNRYRIHPGLFLPAFCQ